MLSEEIKSQRAGIFTASENHRLMAGWDKPNPGRDFEGFDELYKIMKVLDSKPLVRDLKDRVTCNLSKDLIDRTWKVISSESAPAGLVTYAYEKAMEVLFDHDPSLDFENRHTINGHERESDCMRLLSESTGIEFENTGENQIHICANGAGCTPDGIVRDETGLVCSGAEVKCKSPLAHIKNMMISNNDEMKNKSFDAFVQIQTAMLVTGAGHWHFANYNPYAKKEILRFNYIKIKRDDGFIKKLSERLKLANEIKMDMISNVYKKFIK